MTRARARMKQVIKTCLKPVRKVRAKLGVLFDLVAVAVGLILFERYVPFGGLIITGFFLLTGLVAVGGVLVAVLHRLGYLGGENPDRD